MSPEARALLREYAEQRRKEKRMEKVKQFTRDWAWVPLGFVFTWILWKAFS